MIKKLEICDLSYRYAEEDHSALQDITLNVTNDNIVAILGNNGSGKTTLLLLVLKKYIPQRGAIHFLNEKDGTENEIRIGYLPQIEKTPYGFTVSEYVMMGRYPHVGWLNMPDERDREISHSVIHELQIEKLEKKHLGDLSGGELQKVRIARLLAQEPDILLMDEPANHLDLKNRRELLEIIRNLKDENKIILFTTHDPNDAVEIANQVLLMKDGCVVAYGQTHTVMRQDNLQKTFDIPIKLQKINKKTVIIPGE
ncbi:MAG TPA: ABC transporter ATP-binding protein [Anaerolineaceae bacterium]|uniref:ABC transporter related protein n=1 Tax=Anaerolinea thermophila TaxID=167964 RepID=A0A101FY90_9CHLR|nr:MAG: ABC transporter related protein [Anaerolinea thermophila]HAF61340.1 ABC transporter ATP-binding protein [Anaerolineaceae bacterium]